MFSYCTEPDTLGTFRWFSCYLTTGVHFSFYWSFAKVLLLLAITAPVALAFGFLGAMAARARFAPLSWLGKAYIAIVRGVPDIAFFMFFVIALDQLLEWGRHQILCSDWDQAIWQGNDFIVCPQAKLPLSTAPQVVHETYGFFIAVFTFAIVFGAFAANVLPIIETLRNSGVRDLRGIAAALNNRGVRTARGGRWHVSNVKNLVDRLPA